MATNTFTEISLPETKLLADLTGISYDLEHAREFATRLKSALAFRSPDASLVEPLTIASIIQYCRPFSGGKRMNLNDRLLSVFSEDQKAKHAWIRSVRDRHIAHSVNTFEESQPVARYWLERVKDEGIASIECNHHRVIGLSRNDAEAIIELSTALLDYVAAWLKAEKATVLDMIRQMPLETILSDTNRKAYSPSMDNPQRTRR